MGFATELIKSSQTFNGWKSLKLETKLTVDSEKNLLPDLNLISNPDLLAESAQVFHGDEEVENNLILKL